MATGGTDWQLEYEQGRTPWDLRGVSGPLRRLAKNRYFDRLELPIKPRIAVPCCGRGHDLKVFADLGFRTVGFDISPAAVAEAGSLVALNGVQCQLLVRDVLGIAHEFPGFFDLVYDYGGFSAIAPHLQATYVDAMAKILAPRSWLLMLAFPLRPEGVDDPPYLVTEKVLDVAMGPHFQQLDSFPAEDSSLERRGAERWYLFRKRPERVGDATRSDP